FNNGNVASGSYHIPDNILTWPAHGSGNTSHKLSPFIDINHDGLYNPYNGDYPELKGDQMLYWIFNDCLSNHGNTGSKKMGLEIHATAYAYNYENSPTDSIDLVNYQTFLDFMIINRSDTVYNDVYAGIWSDGDLGDPYDDYIGSHVKSNSFYFYNDEFDGNGQTYSYGEHPPVQTITFLKGPLATIDGIDNDHDLVLDEYDEEMLLSKFIHFNNLGFYNPTGDPLYYNDYYNLLRGHWKDSTSLTYDSTGYGGTVEADFAFPGSSDPYGWGTEYTYMPPWSELTVGNTPDDRRGVGSLGPCSLLPGDTIQFTIMFGWFRDTSVSELGIEPFENDIEIVRNWYYHNTFPSDCDVINSIHSPEPEHGNLIVYPNPATDKISISGIPKAEPVTIEIFDVTGQLVKTSSRHVNISVKELEKGLYIIKMYNSDSLGGREVKLIKI
ncbi:MAG: T9SS type A sorting domain-containing protein, partial [Bacteroidota bacterium]